MKARVSSTLNPVLRKACNCTLDMMKEEFARRTEKIILMILHEQFGFGKERCKRFCECFDIVLTDIHEDPIYWDKVDRLLIDKFGLEFGREDYEEMEKVFYQPKEQKKITQEEANRIREGMIALKNYQTVITGGNNHE